MADIQNVKQFFAEILPLVAGDPDKNGGMTASYQFEISGEEGGTWFMNIVDGNGTVVEGPGEAACTIRATDGDWVKIVKGELNPQMAFMQGKIKVVGNMGLALKLQTFLKG